MEILGLIDTLESVVCDSMKIPFTGKTVINEADILSIIDKMRLVLQSGKGFIETKISSRPGEAAPHIKLHEVSDASKPAALENPEGKAAEIIQQAYQVAREIRGGADRYADEVLTKLEATTGRIIRTIKNGRMRLNRAGSAESDAQPVLTEAGFEEALK